MAFLITELLHPEGIIMYGGLTLLLLIVFAETGLFFGFFLPGDSLLFVAGILCGTQYLPMSLWVLIILVWLAAISGSTVGYAFGYLAKGYFERRKENFFYKKEYIEITERFYSRHGMLAFIIGRFLPIVRTFVPILAGIVRISFGKFSFYNVLGAFLWSLAMIVSGHLLGNRFPAVTEYLELIIVGMILVSAIPIVYSWISYKKFPAKEKV